VLEWPLRLLFALLPHSRPFLGPTLVSAPKPAVQPGRWIATVRAEAGLSVPLALMSDEADR
jgi:hypothetical protein